MTAVDLPKPAHTPNHGPPSSLAAAAALEAISSAVRAAQRRDTTAPSTGADNPEQALASLLLLREIREQLAGWETSLVETARQAGASWADLAHPLGVASRQAAERRYLRQRPGPAGTTGEQRVQATRRRRAADRTLTAWARDNAAELRRLAGQISGLTDLPAASRNPVGHLDAALAGDNPVALISPLNAIRPHLTTAHPDLAARLDTLAIHTSHSRHRAGGPGD